MNRITATIEVTSAHDILVVLAKLICSTNLSSAINASYIDCFSLVAI